MSNLGYPFPSLSTSTSADGTVFTNEGPLLNGAPSPGQWLLVDAKRTFGWEIRQGNYLTGATVVPKGDPLMQVRYDIRIWTPNDAGVYRKMLRTTLKKPIIQLTGASSGIITLNSASAAMSIDDPSLKDVSVSSVVVLSASVLYHPLKTSGGHGAWTAEVEFLEFRQPIAALPLPDQTIPDQGPVTPAAVNAQAQAQASIEQGRQSRSKATRRTLMGGG